MRMGQKGFQCQRHWQVICSFVIIENMMNRLFPHISSNESILDQQSNEYSANQQSKKKCEEHKKQGLN